MRIYVHHYTMGPMNETTNEMDMVVYLLDKVYPRMLKWSLFHLSSESICFFKTLHVGNVLPWVLILYFS
jgi:hypothetical protein